MSKKPTKEFSIISIKGFLTKCFKTFFAKSAKCALLPISSKRTKLKWKRSLKKFLLLRTPKKWPFNKPKTSILIRGNSSSTSLQVSVTSKTSYRPTLQGKSETSSYNKDHLWKMNLPWTKPHKIQSSPTGPFEDRSKKHFHMHKWTKKRKIFRPILSFARKTCEGWSKKGYDLSPSSKTDPKPIGPETFNGRYSSWPEDNSKTELGMWPETWRKRCEPSRTEFKPWSMLKPINTKKSW